MKKPIGLVGSATDRLKEPLTRQTLYPSLWLLFCAGQGGVQSGPKKNDAFDRL
jgi:hypothetical protein